MFTVESLLPFSLLALYAVRVSVGREHVTVWEWLAAIGWSAGSVAGGIALYRKVRFFTTLRGIATIAVIGVVSGALHNFLNALFPIDEPFFFLLAIFGIGMTPVLIAQWVFTRVFQLYWRDRRT